MVRVDAPIPAVDAGLDIEVAVSTAPRVVQRVLLRLPVGATVRQALEASGLLEQVADLSLDAIAAGRWSVGVWGRKERPGHVLRDRDRIEVVRPLQVDPKEARRVRYRAHGEKLPKGIHRSPKAVKRADQI